MKVKLQLAYDGSPFGGWQKQKNGKATVQGELEKALSRIFNQPVNTIGSGRTDAGVHAFQQIVHFEVENIPEKLKLIRALNSLTPPEIVIHQAWQAPDEFHALLSAEKKTYKYLISFGVIHLPPLS